MSTPAHLQGVEDAFIAGVPLLLDAVEAHQRQTNFLYSQFPKGTIPDGHGHEFTVPRYGRMKANFGRKAWAPEMEDPENCWDKCNVSAEKLTLGKGKESYHGWRRALESLDICLETTRKTHMYEEAMQVFEHGFMRVTTNVINDFIQDEMISRAGRTLVFLNKQANGLGFALNDQLNLPGAPKVNIDDIGLFSYKSLEPFMPRLQHDGWFHAGVKYGSGGFPIYPLMMSLEEALSSPQRDPNWRDVHVIGQMSPGDVLAGYGVTRTVYNYAQVPLEYAPRWSPAPGATYLDLVNDRVDPEIEDPDALEIGVDFRYNDAYDTAPFEGAFLAIPERVFEIQTPTSLSTVGGKTSFAPLNYTGGMSWLNIQDRETNPQNTKGYYRADLSMAMKPKDRFFLVLMIFRRCRADHTQACLTGFGDFGKASEQTSFPYLADCTLCPDGDTGVKTMELVPGTTDIFRATFTAELPDAAVGDQVSIFGNAGYEGVFTVNGLPNRKRTDFIAKVLPQYILQANDPDNLPATCELITCVRFTAPVQTCSFRWCISGNCGCGCDATGELNPVTGLFWAAEGARTLTALTLENESYTLSTDAVLLQTDIQTALDDLFGDSVATVTVTDNSDMGYSTIVIEGAPAGAFDLQFGSGPYRKISATRYCEETELTVLCNYSLCAADVATLKGKRNRVIYTFDGGPYEAGDHVALDAALTAYLAALGVSGTPVVTTSGDNLLVTLVDVGSQLDALGIGTTDGDFVPFKIHCIGDEDAEAMTAECEGDNCDAGGAEPTA